MVEELAVAVGILDNTEGFLFVHLVLLYLLYLVFLVFVQDVALELEFVLLHFLDVAHAVVEVGGHESFEVGHVHKFRLDCFHHFLIEV